jgi:hypothetical protein
MMVPDHVESDVGQSMATTEPKGVHLCRGRPHEAPTLAAIAVAAKAHWGYPSSFMAGFAGSLDISASYVAAGTARVAAIDDRLGSALSWTAEGGWGFSTPAGCS